MLIKLNCDAVVVSFVFEISLDIGSTVCSHHSHSPTPRRLFANALGSVPSLANMASLAAFGSLAGVARHKIVYVPLLLGLVQPGSAGQPFPTTLPTETTQLYPGYNQAGYTGTLPTQVSGRGEREGGTLNQVRFILKF